MRPDPDAARMDERAPPAVAGPFDGLVHVLRLEDRFEIGRVLGVDPAEAVGAEGPPGRLLDDRLTIACGAGALRLLTVQRPGKVPLGAAEFLRGFKLIAGTVLA